MRFPYVALCAISCVFISACGGSDSEPEPSATPCEAADRDSCLVNQMSCAVSSGKASCVACGLGQYATPEGCTAIAGSALQHDFPEFTTPSGAEQLGNCRSWTLNNDTELFVNAVELNQNEASHHSNWTFVPDNQFDGPDGVWKCSDRKYSQLTAALAGGVIYAQSTQAGHEVQKFPDGVVVRIPPHSRIISDIHILNTGQEAVTGHAQLSIYTIPKSEVNVLLAPFHLTYDGLDIPARSVSRFTGECELASQYTGANPPGFGLNLYYLLPHTHALGTRMFVEVMGGSSDGQSLIDVRGFNSEARGRQYDALNIQGATGLRFGCEFENPRDVNVKWGFDDQEMCEVLGFADSPIAFESRVSDANADGSDGSTQLFTGACSTIAFPWDQTKGGP